MRAAGWVGVVAFTAASTALGSAPAPGPGAAELAQAEAMGLLQAMKISGLPVAQRRSIAVAIVRQARRYEIDPLLIAAVIHAESSFNPLAVSPAGAVGLMQLMPTTARELLGRLGRAPGRTEDLLEPELNIELGTAYLAELVERFGSIEPALVAYNAGPAGARRILADRESRRRFLAGYPWVVTAELRRLRAASERLNAAPPFPAR
ncbi:MAG: lytic transglycosylase domain-containing protein [Myxococcaceae bacterium]